MQKTLNMQNGTGKVIDLGGAVTYIDIATRVECWVKPVYAETAPSAPGASPAPSAGNVSDYVHLAAAGEALELDAARGIPVNSANTKARWNYVLVWPLADGELTVSGV